MGAWSYYNDVNADSVNMLRELIKSKLIPDGEVDSRSISDVLPRDLIGFTQCHFFAGIGGWPLALSRAGFLPTDEIWTGSCPCQPFSSAGKKTGFEDERHLWPDFHRLIAARRPKRILGEQVGKTAGLAWFDEVANDLEESDYSCGAILAEAASFEIPMRRERIYWLAHTCRTGSSRPVQPINVFCPKRRQNKARYDPSGFMAPHVRSQWKTERGRDSKLRRMPTNFEPHTDGLPARVGLLHGYGNAICIPHAVEFCKVAAQQFYEIELGIQY